MRRAPGHNPGFTLLEVIIVVAVMALLMALTVPRLVRQDRRAMQLAVDRVGDLLTMFAQREQLSGKPAGIWHDAERNWIVLMVLDVNPAEPDEPAAWRPDPMVKPVKLPRSISPDGVLLTADGVGLDIRNWPVATEPGQLRERLEFSLLDNDGGVRTVILPAYAMAPYQLDEMRLGLDPRTPIDLDAAGRQREDW